MNVFIINLLHYLANKDTCNADKFVSEPRHSWIDRGDEGFYDHSLSPASGNLDQLNHLL